MKDSNIQPQDVRDSLEKEGKMVSLTDDQMTNLVQATGYDELEKITKCILGIIPTK